MKKKSQIARREFVGGTLAAGAVTAMASGQTEAGSYRGNDLRAGDFAKLVGQTFQLRGNQHYGTRLSSRQAVLEQVSSQPLTSADARVPQLGVRNEPFSLQFAARTGTQLEQGTYRVSHPTLGELDLFIVPEQQQPGSRREHYTVCIS